MEKNFKKLDYDIFTGEPKSSDDDIQELLDKLSKMLLNSSKQMAKKKMSYSISPISQFLIREASEKSGATQGSIVELAPLLFGKIILDSLQRRSKKLETLETLKNQISSSLRIFGETAPHLKAYTDFMDEMIGEIIKMEKDSIENEDFQKAVPKSNSILAQVPVKKETPPYHMEIENFLKGNNMLESLFKKYRE